MVNTKEKSRRGRKILSPEKTVGEIGSETVPGKNPTRQKGDKPSLPPRMFVHGHEPLKKKVNSYFSLNYLELVKKSLEEDQLHALIGSQFGRLLGIGNKIAFSVKFAHFLLCRQLITKKNHEIWVLYGGQPIRFSIREFAIATGLNCSQMTNEDDVVVTESTREFAKKLFGQEVLPTPKWIEEKLCGAPYKDRDTRMRLALLLIVDGVLCRTSGQAKVTLEHVELVRNIDKFLAFPWGRKSFDITMMSIQSTLIHKYSQSSAAIQGFTHALQMVVLACSPNVLTTDSEISSSTGSDDEQSYTVKGIVTKPINLYMPLVRKLDQDDKGRQGDVISIMEAGPDQRGAEKLVMGNDEPDESVDYMISLIRSKHKFSHQSWSGGVRAADVVIKSRKGEESECSQLDINKIIGDVGDACYERVKNLTEDLAIKMQNMFDLAFTELQTDVVLKFCALERMIGGLQNANLRSEATSQIPPDVSASSSSHRTPDRNDANSPSDGCQGNRQRDDISPNSMVRNVLEDLNAVVDDDTDVGDTSTVPFQSPVSGTKNKLTPSHENNVDADQVHEVNQESNQTGVYKMVFENNSTVPEVRNKEQGVVTPSQSELNFEDDFPNTSSEPQPLDQYPRDVKDSHHNQLTYVDPDNVVILLGYVEPENDVMNQEDSEAVPSNTDDVQVAADDSHHVEPPTFSLGLTQELKRRHPITKIYGRRSKRTKVVSSSLDGYVVGLPAKGKQCIVSAMFKKPTKEQVDLLTKLMQKPSYCPEYDGHTLLENNFMELLFPATITSTLTMDVLVSYLHSNVVQHTSPNNPPKYDFLDHTFLNDIGLLHELIDPHKRRKKLPIKEELVKYVMSRRKLYTQVDTLLCPFLMEEKHWVGVVVNLSEHQLTVLDCNHDVVEAPMVEVLLSPFASALPYVTRQLAYNSEMKHDTMVPFVITRPKLKTHVEDQGLTGIASLMLLLLHAENKLDDNIELSRAQIEGASQHYAVELYDAIMKTHSE